MVVYFQSLKLSSETSWKIIILLYPSENVSMPPVIEMSLEKYRDKYW